MTNTTHTVRISCNCAMCETNARYLGVPFPLAAMIRPEAAAILKISDRNADSPKATHGTVYLAHDPIVGKHQQMAIPVG